MAQKIINIGSGPDTRTGDPVRLAFDKVNQNFDELYNITGDYKAIVDLEIDGAAAALFTHNSNNGISFTYDSIRN